MPFGHVRAFTPRVTMADHTHTHAHIHTSTLPWCYCHVRSAIRRHGIRTMKCAPSTHIIATIIRARVQLPPHCVVVHCRPRTHSRGRGHPGRIVPQYDAAIDGICVRFLGRFRCAHVHGIMCDRKNRKQRAANAHCVWGILHNSMLTICVYVCVYARWDCSESYVCVC